MSKLFYDHLVMIDDVITEIESLDIETEEKGKLKKMIDSMTHHRVIEGILDLLPEDSHHDFLERLYESPHDTKHLRFLQNRIAHDITHEIIQIGKELKEELLKEIKSYKKD